MVDRRLNSWKNMFVALGGQVVLVNSVLNFIPIFYLSFFKLPVEVWAMLVRSQIDFLCKGVLGARKIPWVKWSKICKTKNDGGRELGVKDLMVMNKALLPKWR